MIDPNDVSPLGYWRRIVPADSPADNQSGTPRAALLDRKQFEQAVDELEQSRLDVYRTGFPLGRMDPLKWRSEVERVLAHHAAARQALLDQYDALERSRKAWEDMQHEAALEAIRYSAEAEEVRAELAALRQDRERERAALERYGQHALDCPAHPTFPHIGLSIEGHDEKCYCGWDAALAAARQAGRTEDCRGCDGRGYIAHDPTQEPCSDCGGTGTVESPSDA